MQQWLNTGKTMCALKCNIQGKGTVANDKYFIDGNATVAKHSQDYLCHKI